jgi:hypothetical protein
MAATNDYPPTAHDLLFAVSTSSSAIDGPGAWDRYDIPVCDLPASNLVPDQPILGYNKDWAAVDVLCADQNGDFGNATDSLVLVPDSSIKSLPLTATPNQMTISPPLFASRPSRDVSASGYEPLILASAQFVQNSPPQVALYGIPASSASATPMPTPLGTSPSFGYPGLGSSALPYAPQPGCTDLPSNCMINISDQRRIQQVILQQNALTERHDIFTSFTAGYEAGTEVVYFVSELETGLWQGFYQGVFGSGAALAYPTITANGNLDIYASLTTFSNVGEYPNFTNFYAYQWYQDTNPLSLINIGQSGRSTGVFTGANSCPTATPTGGATPSPTPTPTGLTVRWGDYNSMISDPSQPDPDGTLAGFWNVLEFTAGASDQETVWAPIEKRNPFYFSYAFSEQECNVPFGSNCTANFAAPAADDGYVVIAAVTMGGSFKTPPTPPDSTWVSLPISNFSNDFDLMSGDCSSGDLATHYVYAHVYGSSAETGTYQFKHLVYNFCNGSYKPELEGFLVSYGGANTNFASYALYGYLMGTKTNTVTVGPAPASAPGPGTLLNIFWSDGPELPEKSEDDTTFTAPTGATAETPLYSVTTDSLLADVPIPSSGATLQASTTTSSFSQFHPMGWQLFMSE